MPREVLTDEERVFRRNESSKRWRDANRDKIADNNRKFRDTNPDYFKEWWQSDIGKKVNRINNWRQNGIVHPDMDMLYERYVNTTHCENCTVELKEGRGTNGRCCDHFHSAPEPPLLTNVRGIICCKCNVRRR